MASADSQPPIRIGGGTPITLNIKTMAVVMTVSVSAVAGWLSKPGKAEVTEIANVAGDTAARSVVANSDAINNKGRDELHDQIKAVEAAAKEADRDRRGELRSINRKTDAILLLLAEQRGPTSLRRVRENLANDETPTHGILAE